MQVRVRLGAGLSSLAAAPMLTVEVPEDGTVADLCARLRETRAGARARARRRAARRRRRARPVRPPPRRPPGSRLPPPHVRGLIRSKGAPWPSTTRPPRTRPSSSTPSPTACSAPTCAMLGPVARRRPHRVELDARLLGADDHARDPRRPRGLPPGRRRGRRGRRRDRHPHQGHRGHVRGHVVGQRPADGRALQRRSVLRGGLPGLRDGVAGDAARGHRPGGRPLRELRRGLHAVHVHQRLHDGVRRGPQRRRDAPGERAEALARDAARAAALPERLGAEPDPHLRAARHRRARHAAAPVPRPVRHLAVDDDPRLPQRGRLRRVPRRRAAPLRARRAGAAARTRPTGTWTSTRSAPGRCSSARSRCPAAACTWATCTRSRATARSPATPPTWPAP